MRNYYCTDNKNLHLIFVPYIGHWGRGKNLSKVHLERTLEQFPVCCNKMTIKLACARMPSGLLESRVGRYCRVFVFFVFFTQKRLLPVSYLSHDSFEEDANENKWVELLGKRGHIHSRVVET